MIDYTIEEQVNIIEKQINSPIADFSLWKKMEYIHTFFKPDFDKEAKDIVISNLCRQLKGK